MSLHYTSTMTKEELDCDFMDTINNTNLSFNNLENLDENKSYDIRISPYQKHIHHESLESQDCRDFHQLIIDMYNSLDNNEKNNPDIIRGFNNLIHKWHYTPQEMWNSSTNNIWINTGLFLNKNFPPHKYPKLIQIFNNL